MKRTRGSSLSSGKRARTTAVVLRGRKARSRRSYIPRFRSGYNRTGGYYGRFFPAGEELKFFDTAHTFSFDSTPEVPAGGQLCLIPQGVTESTRVGRKCTVRSISMKGTLTYNPGTSTAGATTIWLTLVLDKQCNGAAATNGDVYVGNPMNNFRNMANISRFTVLKRIIIDFNSTAGVSGAYSASQKTFGFTKKCNIPLEFSSTTGALTELKTNNLFLLANSYPGDDLVTIAGVTRIRFSDN